MFRMNLNPSLVALAVMTGLLTAAGPAGAIVYNGHAGLGSSAYQHNQTDLEYARTVRGEQHALGSALASGVRDGTSNTLETALGASARGIAADGVGADGIMAGRYGDGRLAG